VGLTDQPIRCAIVGYGLAGKTFHAPLIAATPGLELCAVASSRPDAVRSDWPKVETVAHFESLLADPRVDLIVIATPDELHATQAKEALKAGKHVVVDKPFAVTLAEAQAIAAEAAHSTKICTVFQNRRWDADFLTLQALIAAGELGEIVQFESHYDRYRPTLVDRWKEKPGAGVWQDLGPHLVDQALQLFGLPLAVFADLAGQKDGAPVADYAHVLLRYPRLRVILHASQIAHDPSLRYVVHGTNGSFVKHGLDVQEAQSKAGLIPGTLDWGVDPLPGTLTRRSDDGETRRLVDGQRGDYPQFYSRLRDALTNGSPPPVTIDQALQVMQVIDAGHRSSASRREIELAAG
jgi:predicted dehydrogenase